MNPNRILLVLSCGLAFALAAAVRPGRRRARFASLRPGFALRNILSTFGVRAGIISLPTAEG